MAEMIAIFLGLLKKGDIQQAEKRLDNSYRDFLKQDAAFFHKIDKELLSNELINKHHYTNGHLKILSELLFAEGELNLAKKNYQWANECYQKALIIFNFVEKEAATFSLERIERKNLLSRRIDELKNLTQND